MERVRGVSVGFEVATGVLVGAGAPIGVEAAIDVLVGVANDTATRIGVEAAIGVSIDVGAGMDVPIDPFPLQAKRNRLVPGKTRASKTNIRRISGIGTPFPVPGFEILRTHSPLV